MCTYLGASTELTPEDVPTDIIEQSAIVYLEGYLFDPSDARRAFAKAAGIAHSSNRLIGITLSDSFVVERHRGELMGFIEGQADIVFANEDEVKALFQTDDFEIAAAKLGAITNIAAITRGEQGSLILAGQNSHRIPADHVDKVLDTTGAGDQYAAGVLYGLAKGLPFDICGQLGSMAAAEVIGHYGPRPEKNLRDLAISKGLLK
jgi:sugar/nucleoside kinase (ribokinase family)